MSIGITMEWRRLFTFSKEKRMSTLQEQIVVDQAACEAANAQLAKDQAALNAIVPHLSVLTELEAELKTMEAQAAAKIAPLVAKLRALFNA